MATEALETTDDGQGETTSQVTERHENNAQAFSRLEVAEDNDQSLIYQRATTLQITKHFQNNAQAWSAPLPERDYLVIQHQLSELELCAAKMAYWVLFSKKDPDTIISSCTTSVRDVITNTGQGVRPAKAVIVTDVFTHSHHRFQGMATRLLKDVQATLDRKPDERVEFSLIYSGVHTEFYERLGWKPYPAKQMRLILGALEIDRLIETDELKILNFDALCDWVHRDVTISKLRLSGMRDAKAHVQILPSPQLMTWHLMRCKMFSQYMARTKPQPTLHGATHEDPDTTAAVWVWWVHDFKTRRLQIGRLVATRHQGLESAIKLVLRAAVVEARAWGFREVVLWDPTSQVVTGAHMLADELGNGVQAVAEDRAEMIPCLRWHGGKERDIGWEERQYYGWA